MLPTEYSVRVTYKKIGSALTGRDLLCLDGQYRTCRTFFRDGSLNPKLVKAEFTADPAVYSVELFGPYSNTAGS